MLIENNAKISKSPPSLNAAVWENAKTALSRIFFARTWMDSAQKSLLMDWLNARIITSTDPFRMKTSENFAAFGSKHRKFFEVIFSDVLIRNGFEVVA